MIIGKNKLKEIIIKALNESASRCDTDMIVPGSLVAMMPMLGKNEYLVLYNKAGLGKERFRISKQGKKYEIVIDEGFEEMDLTYKEVISAIDESEFSLVDPGWRKEKC